MEPLVSPSPSMADLLARGPRAWTKLRLWRGLPPELRADLAEALLAAPDPSDAQLLLAEVARHANHRQQKLRQMSPRAVAELASRISNPSLPLFTRMAQLFLLGNRVPMLSDYLDGLGLPHHDGLLTGDGTIPEIEGSRSIEVVTRLFQRYPADEVAFYLAFLHIQSPKLVAGAVAWLQEQGGRWRAGVAEAVEDAPVPALAEASETASPEVIQPKGPEHRLRPGAPFSKLDNLLIRAIVDSVQGVVGASPPEDLEDLVNEYIALNGRNHQSFFHRGFLDALTDLPYREALEAENETRRGWYQAGWATGLGRQNRQAEIATLPPKLRKSQLAPDSLQPWNRYLYPLLFDALCATGRPTEGLQYLQIPILVQRPDLLHKLLEVGTTLLREGDAEAAQLVLKHLASACRNRGARGAQLPGRFGIEVSRRLAHCYRLLGDAPSARELLLELAEEELEPGLRAMIDADLGLLDGHLRALADVRLWKTDAERPDILSALELGRARFEAAVASETRYASHGAWPLAILAMGKGEWAEASELLSMTLTGFQEAPERYQSANLLARVKIAAGIAGAMVMEYARLPRAATLLLEGMDEGGRIPLNLLGEVLEALGVHEESLAEDVLTRVLDLDEAISLEKLESSAVIRRTPAVADHLLTQGKKSDLPSPDRARALAMAIPIFLSQRTPRLDEARLALDLLEELAHSNKVARSVFRDLLYSESGLDPVWSTEDVTWALVSLHEIVGESEQALGILQGMLARALGIGASGAELEAEGIVERALSYGIRSEVTRVMENRLSAWKAQYAAPEPPRVEALTRILIVGGSDSNRELKDRVQHDLNEQGHNIRVEHLMTGWSGNWSRTLDDALRMARARDAVVLLRFMRTEFGRSLRAQLHQPWVSCPIASPAAVTRSVLKAASWARASSVYRGSAPPVIGWSA